MEVKHNYCSINMLYINYRLGFDIKCSTYLMWAKLLIRSVKMFMKLSDTFKISTRSYMAIFNKNFVYLASFAVICMKQFHKMNNFNLFIVISLFESNIFMNMKF